MHKWSCLWVIIDFLFDQQQLKLGHVSFCTDAIAKQSVLGNALPSLLVWDRKRNKVCWMRSCSSLCDTVFLTLFSNRNTLSQSAFSCTHRCHSIRESIQHCTAHVFPTQPLLASSKVSIYRNALFCYQDWYISSLIASCLHDLLTFKECCGLDTCTCGHGF